MRLHQEQLVPVGIAEPEHRRLGLRLLNGANAGLQARSDTGDTSVDIDSELLHVLIGVINVAGVEDDPRPDADRIRSCWY